MVSGDNWSLPCIRVVRWKGKGQSSTVDLVSALPQQHILNYVKAYRWWTLNGGGRTGDAHHRKLSSSWRETK